MNILKTILIVRKKGKEPLPIYGSSLGASWRVETWESWNEYKNAMDEIYSFNKHLFRFLKWTRII